MGMCCLQPILKLDYTCEFRIKSLKIWCPTQTKEPCVFRANPASKTLRALAMKSWRRLWTEFSDAPHIHEASVGGLAELHKCTDHSCDLWWHSAAVQNEIAFCIQSCMFQFWRFASSRPCINFEEWQYSFHPFCEFLSISLCLWVYKRNRILHPVVHGSILNPISFCRHLSSSIKAEGIGWVIQNILLRVLNMSTSARTRKMENNACEERSQEKLWWRFITILTCKSFVILGYRSKRTKVLDESFRILC